MSGNRDFSHDIDGLVDASVEAAIKGDTAYVGSIQNFDLVVHDWLLLLTRPGMSGDEASSLSSYLKSRGWNSGGVITVHEGQELLQGTYLDVNRITQRREFLDEMRVLSGLLNDYRVLVRYKPHPRYSPPVR